MIKTLGVILLLSGSLYLCFSFSAFERRRVLQCEGFLLLLRHIRAQIACFRMPHDRIWESYSSAELARCGFLDALREKGDFTQALLAVRSQIWLSREELDLLLAFGGELGRSYFEDQVSCCDYYIGELEQAYAERRSEQPKRVKLYRSLFLTGSLMLVIILL